MSIEKSLDSIAASLAYLVSIYKTDPAAAPAPTPAAAVPAMAPAPVPMPAPAPVPAVPAFMAPAPAPATPPAPFVDQAGLMEYIKSKYRSLGPVKGALIQNSLTEIGCRNINDVTPEQYGVFYQKVEALS